MRDTAQRKVSWVAVVLASVALVLLASAASGASHEEDEYISCKLAFEAKAWAFLIERGDGTGHVTCDNGQEADVIVKISAAGISFGKLDVQNGHGDFAYVTDIDDVFGRYEGSAASVGAGDTAAAAGLLKAGGKVKLGLYGTGEGGVGISRSWGVVTIERKPE